MYCSMLIAREDAPADAQRNECFKNIFSGFSPNSILLLSSKAEVTFSYLFILYSKVVSIYIFYYCNILKKKKQQHLLKFIIRMK